MKKIMHAVAILAMTLLINSVAIAQKTILIKCGKLLDTKEGKVLENQYVLLKGNTVVSVSKTASKADSSIDLND